MEAKQKAVIIWFKRDLRLFDNPSFSGACTEAAQNSKCAVLPLYILEPELWRQPDLSYRHFKFLIESLHDLNASLQQYSSQATDGGLVVKVGEVCNVFERLGRKFDIKSVWSIQETWNGWTYRRNSLFKSWCEARGMKWYQPAQNGVVRNLESRDKWSKLWEKFMNENLIEVPKSFHVLENARSDIELNEIQPKDFGIYHDGIEPTIRQQGGREHGLELLHSFLYERCERYAKEISSPLTAEHSGSRLSPYLAFGCLSMREIFQATEKRKSDMRNWPKQARGMSLSSLSTFSSRLRWHCHFIQKLEDEPQIEYANLHSAYNGMREYDWDENRFIAWKEGRTGYPMVDASMRYLKKSGWINFRMRAMLVSFAVYHLWLHWRKVGIYLANLFTDYEPGIHYSQIQMQAGTTGINTIRIYNPTKQGLDQDPEGRFLKRWLPELRNISITQIHTPWKACNKMLNGYPEPIVDESEGRKLAMSRIYSVRKSNSHKDEKDKIVEKHASRMKWRRQKQGLKKSKAIVECFRKKKKLRIKEPVKNPVRSS